MEKSTYFVTDLEGPGRLVSSFIPTLIHFNIVHLVTRGCVLKFRGFLAKKSHSLEIGRLDGNACHYLADGRRFDTSDLQ